jgi:hypothetical protein
MFLTYSEDEKSVYEPFHGKCTLFEYHFYVAMIEKNFLCLSRMTQKCFRVLKFMFIKTMFPVSKLFLNYATISND